MPSKPPRACASPGCPLRQPCPQHNRKGWRGVRSQGYRTQDGQPSDWPTIRAAVLRERPWCEWVVNVHALANGKVFYCGAPARHVDHRVPKSRGGDDSPANLQPLCPPHHHAKTGREGRQAR